MTLKRGIYLFIFLLIVAVSLFQMLIKMPLPQRIIISFLPALLTAFLYFQNFKLFVPSLFFAINSVLSPFIFLLISRYHIHFPQINFLLPIFIYVGIILKRKSLRKEVTWLTWGQFDSKIILYILITVFISCVSLVVWVLWIKRDLSDFANIMPEVPFFHLLMYGVAFAVFNSMFEEMVSRAFLYEGFLKLFSGVLPPILFQAMIFALWHYQGFPGGITGVVMVFIWSVLLGFIRNESRGMLAPLVAHFFADSSIALLLFLSVSPGKGMG